MGFPASPTDGQIYTNANGTRYEYDDGDNKWTVIGGAYSVSTITVETGNIDKLGQNLDADGNTINGLRAASTTTEAVRYDEFNSHITTTEAHINNITDISTRNHNDLQSIDGAGTEHHSSTQESQWDSAYSHTSNTSDPHNVQLSDISPANTNLDMNNNNISKVTLITSNYSSASYYPQIYNTNASNSTPRGMIGKDGNPFDQVFNQNFYGPAPVRFFAQ